MTHRLAVFVLLTLLLSITVRAQNRSIQGTVIDSSENIPLHNTSVVLLQARDSFIVAAIRANNDGKFVFKNLADTGNYVLFFSYPQYASYAVKVNMKDANNGVIEMNKINLRLKSKLLQEVIVKSQVAAIKIKGDTTEYKANRFTLQPNATVEDLLKQLPGLEVDQFGNITAQGQKVKKVLVDGEEFFSDDPTLVTRNLRADMIDRVQVYDKRSDAAAFTGIEDGIKNKTINLKLREDKNHGIFGKADAGAGTDQHYNAQGIINFFKGKRRMSAFATTGNVGRTGLGAADKGKIGDDEQGSENYSGKGLPKITSGGFHYDNKWNANKNSLNINYKFNITNVSGIDTTTSQNNLLSGIIVSNSGNQFNNSSTNNKATVKYIQKPDSTSTITIYSDGALQKSINQNNSTTVNRRGDSSLIYTNQLINNNDYSLNTYNLNVSWEKRLRKRGRTVSFYLNNNFSNDAATGESISNSTFYDAGGNTDSTVLLHLRKTMNDNWRSLMFNSIYTEPLSGKLSLIVNLALNNEDAHDDKRSYNPVTNPVAKTIDTAFSTVMNATTWSSQQGAALSYASKKMVLKMGNNIKEVRMTIENMGDPQSLRKQYTGWNPNLNLDYKFSNFKGLNFNYTGTTDYPLRSQLVPFNYNNSQLIIYLPNPDLKSSFTHNFTGRFQTTQIASQVYLGGNAGYTLTAGPITQSVTVDPSGVYNYRYVNMNGYTNSTYYLNAYYSQKIKPVDLQAGAGLAVNGGRSFSPINSSINKLNYTTYTFLLELFKTRSKKYSLYLITNCGYTQNSSSLQPATKNNYFSYTVNPSIDVYFLKKLQLHTDASYFWQQKTQTFNDNYSRMIWNAWLGRSFLKNDQLTVKISCNDILNENNGYTRTATNTFFSENRYTTIRRFIMAGATWSFTKFNTQKQ